MNNENIKILKPFFSGLPIVIIAVLLSIFAANKYLEYATPVYESTAKMKLADVKDGTPSENLYKDFDAFSSANKINTEIEVLKSSNLLEKTLSQLPFSTEIYRKGEVRSVELFRNSPILAEATFADDSNYDKKFTIEVLSKTDFMVVTPEKKEIKGQFGEPININRGKMLISLNEDYLEYKPTAKIIDTYEVIFLSRENLLLKTEKNLDVVSVDKDVPVVRINYKSNVPEKAALLVNKLSETYIQDYLENKYKAANTTLDFLKKEIAEANGKLAFAENKIQNYRDKNNIINITQETETDLRHLAQLKIQQSSVKMNLRAVQQINQYVTNGKGDFMKLAPNFEGFNDLLSTELMKNIKKLQAEKKDLLLTYTPEHEKVKNIDSKVKDLVDYQTESIKNSEKDLQTKFKSINGDVARVARGFVGLPQKERMMTILNREFNLYEKNYNFLNEKRIEAEIAKSAKITFHKVITQGEIAKQPVAPIRSIILIVAAIAGLFLSLIIIYSVHFARAKVHDLQTIEKNSAISVAYTTPKIKKEKEIENNFIKNVLELDLKDILENKNVLTISAYDMESGHLFHTRNVIKALRKQGRNVLVADVTGDLYNDFGREDYINFSENENRNKTKEQLHQMIATQMSNYDLCIVHNQPIKNGALPIVFMSFANHNLVILDSNKTAEKTIGKIDLLVEEFQLPKTWFVLNKIGFNPTIVDGFRKYLVKK